MIIMGSDDGNENINNIQNKLYAQQTFRILAAQSYKYKAELQFGQRFCGIVEVKFYHIHGHKI